MARLSPELLADRTAVVETIDRLFVLADRRDWDALAGLFAPAADLDLGAGGPLTGAAPRQAADAWRADLRDCAASHHQTGNHLVTVQGTRAEACCYVTAVLARAGAPDTAFTAACDVRLARTPLGWAVTSLRLVRRGRA
jgi:hypothetical protein